MEQGPVVIRLADVLEGEVSLANPRRGKMSGAEIDTYKLLEGDLLFVRVNGSLDLVGRCVPFRGAAETVCYNDHFVRVRLDRNVFEPEYVALMGQ